MAKVSAYIPYLLQMEMYRRFLAIYSFDFHLFYHKSTVLTRQKTVPTFFIFCTLYVIAIGNILSIMKFDHIIHSVHHLL